MVLSISISINIHIDSTPQLVIYELAEIIRKTMRIQSREDKWSRNRNIYIIILGFVAPILGLASNEWHYYYIFPPVISLLLLLKFNTFTLSSIQFTDSLVFFEYEKYNFISHKKKTETIPIKSVSVVSIDLVSVIVKSNEGKKYKLTMVNNINEAINYIENQPLLISKLKTNEATIKKMKDAISHKPNLKLIMIRILLLIFLGIVVISMFVLNFNRMS